MQKYIGSDVTSMVTLPVIIFEPMTMLQKMAEVYFDLHEKETLDDKHIFVVIANLQSHMYFTKLDHCPTNTALSIVFMKMISLLFRVSLRTCKSDSVSHFQNVQASNTFSSQIFPTVDGIFSPA